MKKVLRLKFLIGSFLLSSYLYGQEWSKIQEIALPYLPVSFSVDVENNLYLGFNNGSLIRYTKNGEASPAYSVPNQSSITLIEAQNNRKIFLFYRDIQQITILDRFSSIPKNYPLSDFNVYLANAACPAPDGTFWTIENNPQRLKKIDPLRKIVVHEVQHALGDSTFFMRVYQNLLFVADELGVHILDQFGNLISTIDMGKTTYLQLSNETILATTADNIFKISPHQTIKTDTLNLSIDGDHLFLLDQNIATINHKKLAIYSREK